MSYKDPVPGLADRKMASETTVDTVAELRLLRDMHTRLQQRCGELLERARSAESALAKTGWERSEQMRRLLIEWLDTPWFSSHSEWQKWVEDFRPRVESAIDEKAQVARTPRTTRMSEKPEDALCTRAVKLIGYADTCCKMSEQLLLKLREMLAQCNLMLHECAELESSMEKSLEQNTEEDR